jgi:hypothetical protein
LKISGSKMPKRGAAWKPISRLEASKSVDPWQSYCGLALLLRDDSYILGCIGID